jgi:hypothetical protein
VPILARVLRERGLVSEDQLELAIQHQVLYGGRLGTSLHELGFITEDGLQQALARAHGVAGVVVDPQDIEPEAMQLLPRALASRHKVFPYRTRGKTLFLLMVDPQDHTAIAKVSFSLGYIVKPLVVPEFRMIQLLRDHYGIDERWRFDDTYRPPVFETVPGDPEAAAARFETATTRDEIVEALLTLCLTYFKRVAFFIVRAPWVLGWTGQGDWGERALVTSLRIPLDRPSVFRNVTRDRSVFIGRFGQDEEDRRFLKAIGKRAGTAAVFPILVRGRVVNLVYGDGGPAGNLRGDLGELLALVQRVSRAYLRIIRKRVAFTREAAGGVPGNKTKENA